MIAVDTNILVYAHREELPKHKAAAKVIKKLAEGDEPWCIPVFCLGEFLRVISHPKLFQRPHSTEEAIEAIERILESPSLEILYPGEKYLALLKDSMKEAGVQGNLVFDAQIIAQCRERGVRVLLTEDRDFARFSKVICQRL